MPSLKNYVGEVISNFKIVEDLGLKFPRKSSKQKRHYFIAECQECGNKREGMIEAFQAKRTKCECKYIPLKTKEWKRIAKIYLGMMDRCFNKKSKDYKKWGAKDITVCDEWKNSLDNFYKWSLKNGYADNLSIDRIDNNGNYEPSNCRWADNKTQMRNRNLSTPIEKIKQIKLLLHFDYTQNQIAEMTKTTYGIVKGVKSGRCWADVTI